MQHQQFEPPVALSDAIKCFWYNSQNYAGQGSDFEVVPDGYAEIIFHFGSGCSMVHNGALKPLPSPFMMGILNQPIIFHAQNHLQLIAIRCYPWTVFDLLGLPSGKTGAHIVDHPIAQLQPVLNQLIAAGNIAEAIALVTNYFLTAKSQITDNSMLFKAGHAMSKTGGTLPVTKVAAAAHTTLRTLERKFKQSSGYSVKDVSGLMRFEQVRNHLWQYPNCNIAGLAHHLGYTDQAHLSREFKRYSGTTPAAFARKAKQIINSGLVTFAPG